MGKGNVQVVYRRGKYKYFKLEEYMFKIRNQGNLNKNYFMFKCFIVKRLYNIKFGKGLGK